MQTFKPVLGPQDLVEFIRAAFPQMPDEAVPQIVSIDEEGLYMIKPYDPQSLRPGGTISGPTMMALVDQTMYMAVAAVIGPEAMAVTSSLNIDFLNRAEPAALHIKCKLSKLGRTLAVGRAELWSEGSEKLAAQATVTYSLVRTLKD